MFLHRCCFLIEDDMSIASFDNPCTSISRASLAGYELQTMIDKEIIFIKRSPKLWYEVEEESLQMEGDTDDTSSTRTKSSSKSDSRKSTATERYVMIDNSVNTVSGDNERNGIECVTNSYKRINKLNAIKKRLPALHIAESSSYIFPTKRPIASSTSRVLDWFMSCCWRCSPGCQQLPSLNM